MSISTQQREGSEVNKMANEKKNQMLKRMVVTMSEMDMKSLIMLQSNIDVLRAKEKLDEQAAQKENKELEPV